MSIISGIENGVRGIVKKLQEKPVVSNPNDDRHKRNEAYLERVRKWKERKF